MPRQELQERRLARLISCAVLAMGPCLQEQPPHAWPWCSTAANRVRARGRAAPCTTLSLQPLCLLLCNTAGLIRHRPQPCLQCWVLTSLSFKHSPSICGRSKVRHSACCIHWFSWRTAKKRLRLFSPLFSSPHRRQPWSAILGQTGRSRPAG